MLQGVFFGLCHGYQGAKSVVTLSVYGCLFGLLAQRRRSLRPGMIAHFLQDGAGGLAMREATGVFQDKSGLVMMMIMGQTNEWNWKMIEDFCASIR